MLRQLLAFLALVTGFAALYAPAQAAVASSASVEVQQSAETVKAAKSAETACARRQKAQRMRGETVTPCASQSIVVFLPTVHFGADRARE